MTLARTDPDQPLNHYIVLSPVFESGGDNYEPPESGRDVVTIWADSPSTAKILAIRSKGMRSWVRFQRDDNQNPFTGLEVQSGKCPHGKCYCFLCEDECEECEKEADEYDAKNRP